jgi:hypothetical protein
MLLLSAAVVAVALTSGVGEARIQQVETGPVTVHALEGKGDLHISFVSSGTYGSVPRGANRIELGTFNFSASCEADIAINSIEIKHVGLGETTDISRVYLGSDFRRMSRARTFDTRSQIAELRTPSLVVPACSAVPLSVYIDLSADAAVASEHGVAFLSPASVRSSAKNMTYSNEVSPTTVRALPINAGEVSVRFLPLFGRLRYGHTETIARIQFSADASHDYVLKKITLTNQESARDMDFTNIRLETRSGKSVTLEFSPSYILERSRTVVFLLRAKNNVTQYRKVDFYLEEPSDLGIALYRPERR